MAGVGSGSNCTTGWPRLSPRWDQLLAARQDLSSPLWKPLPDLQNPARYLKTFLVWVFWKLLHFVCWILHFNHCRNVVMAKVIVWSRFLKSYFLRRLMLTLEYNCSWRILVCCTQFGVCQTEFSVLRLQNAKIQNLYLGLKAHGIIDLEPTSTFGGRDTIKTVANL